MKLNKEISKIGLNRLRVISNGTGISGDVTEKLKLTFLAELTSLGYIVSNPESFTDNVL